MKFYVFFVKISSGNKLKKKKIDESSSYNPIKILTFQQLRRKFVFFTKFGLPMKFKQKYNFQKEITTPFWVLFRINSAWNNLLLWTAYQRITKLLLQPPWTQKFFYFYFSGVFLLRRIGLQCQIFTIKIKNHIFQIAGNGMPILLLSE